MVPFSQGICKTCLAILAHDNIHEPLKRDPEHFCLADAQRKRKFLDQILVADRQSDIEFNLVVELASVQEAAAVRQVKNSPLENCPETLYRELDRLADSPIAIPVKIMDRFLKPAMESDCSMLRDIDMPLIY